MGPRLSFAVSLGLACGLNALILLVPRFAGVTDEKAPSIELTIEHGGRLNAGYEPGPAMLRGAAPAAAAPQQAPASGVVPAPPGEESKASLLPGTAEPAADIPAAGGQEPAQDAGGAPAGAPPGAGAAPAWSAAGTGGFDPSGDSAAGSPFFIPAHPQAEILPTYPRSARKAGQEGIVRITASIDESGVVVSAEILSSSGHAALDKAALQAVQRAHFQPALQAGRSVPCRLIIPVRFRLN
jgi:protein TonB